MHKRLVPIVWSAAIFVACESTQPLCACQPPGGSVSVIAGSVTTPAGAPVTGAAVRVRLLDAACAQPQPNISTAGTQSLSDGRFRYGLGRYGAGENCYHVWAEAPAGMSFSPSATALVRIQFHETGAVPDSTELSLALRP